MIKESEKKKRLHNRVLVVMKKKDNWGSPNFFISDNELNFKIRDEDKGTIYSNIRYYSEKALDKIYDLMHEDGHNRDFSTAVHDAKHEHNLILLNKIKDNPSRGIIGGWQQPTLAMLDFDQRKRLFDHEKGHDTSINRTKKIDAIKDLDVIRKKPMTSQSGRQDNKQRWKKEF